MSSRERVLVSKHSPFNRLVLTEDESGLRTLRFGSGGVRQSVVNPADPTQLELPYARVLPVCLAFVNQPRRILVVGLGGGTLPRFFHRLLPDATLDVVEIDPDVVEIARSHCGFTEDDRLRVHVGDGRDFIEDPPVPYDLVILDSFDSESIPAHLLTVEFLQAVRRSLSPEGIAVANVWGRASNRLYDDMLLTYREAFKDVYIFDVPNPGTKIFIALQAPHPLTREDLLHRTRELASRHPLLEKLSQSITGFRNADSERLRRGAVLRD